MKYNLHVLIILSATLLFNSVNAQKNMLGFSLIQNGHEYKITGDRQRISLTKDAFKLMFNSFEYTDKKPYATQIEAFTDIKGLTMIYNGLKIEEIPYFSSGTDMACDANKEYDCLYIDKRLRQNQSILYEEKGEKRANLEGRSRDTLKLSWTIDKFSLDNKKESDIKEIGIKTIYLVIMNDFNLNGIVDPGEYSIVRITFE